jgi:phytoene/squalene synthetase
MFDKSLRTPIYAIYAYVRVADEIVDTFFDQDQGIMLEEFEQETWQAIKRGMSTNPVLHSFQKIVNQYGIEKAHIKAFLDSMAMDLVKSEHVQESYDEYIYGSAEVVGLMCLKVFCDNNKKLYNELEPFAKQLGSAFQKVNFLRDLKSDFDQRGRVYFPGVDFSQFTEQDKLKIQADIEKEFDVALEGIRKLPSKAKFGVYLAYKYYRKLFNKIKSSPATDIKNARIRVPDSTKMYLLASSALKNKLNLL